MKKISFLDDVLPHIIAVAFFLVVTVFFFKPVFFDNKSLQQHDIQQFQGSAKAIIDYRNQTGEEALWTNSMFSGMPAYLISVQWGNKVLGYLKAVLAIGLPHPVANIFLAFLSYYILLLAFRIRPYLAIAGAVAFGLSSYMVIGLMAGHNARIGAIALMPLVVAGIHLIFTGKRILGFGITTAGLALHLRENHLQMTYYLLIILVVYGLVQLIYAFREGQLNSFSKSVGIIVAGSLIAFGAFFGPFWAINEYQKYSTRGKAELVAKGETQSDESGLPRDYAFDYSNGILEPFVLMIPNFYGGSSSNYLVQDRNSATYKALSGVNNEQMANQLVNYTGSYWGPQTNTAPYYGGAIVVFLFAIGIAFADRKYLYWLIPVSVLGVVLSWGSHFPSFNYFLFDFLPGYNKFRSVTFTLVMILFAMPLLGMLGVEKLWQGKFDKSAKRKMLIVFGVTGGLCLLMMLLSGLFNYSRDFESQLPEWFVNALVDDRKGLFLSDAFRSFSFITAIFILIYFDVYKKISPTAVYAFLILMITIDLAVVDKRYFTESSYKRKRDNSFFAPTEADQGILQDKSYYRVYNLESPFQEARTSYYHNSIGGYHGAKLRRYQDFYDSCIVKQTRDLITNAQQGNVNFSGYGAINMLNIKYIVYGPARNNVLFNRSASGPAWFVQDVVKVKTANEEMTQTCGVNTRTTAVINETQFTVPEISSDSASTISIIDRKPNYLKYESESTVNGLAVFSEIYYPDWKATVDGNEVNVLQADYILRALPIPAGKHTIEFRFEPKAYFVGNKITTASSWIVVLVLLGAIGWSLRKTEEN
jgi:hypothetical protein